MNRRSFLGFACGGVVAAPAAVLVGEQAISSSAATSGVVIGERKLLASKPITVEITGVGGDEHIRRIAQRAVDVAMRQAEIMRQRGQSTRA